MTEFAGVRLGFEAAFPKEDLHHGELRRKKKKEICQDFQRGRCRYTNDNDCPYRHATTRHVQARVCKHWLRGACVNGDSCVFLHEYNERFVPQCAFFERIGECTNPECPFLHSLPQEQLPECAAYKRGFCSQGPQCPLRHTPRAAADCCPFYMAGFCPLGPQCWMAHPVQELYDWSTITRRIQDQLRVQLANDPSFNPTAVCHREDCLDPGHTAPNCPGPQFSRVHKQLSEVREPGEKTLDTDIRGGARRCFVCHQEGHQAKDCPMNAARGGMGGQRRGPPPLGGGGMMRGGPPPFRR